MALGPRQMTAYWLAAAALVCMELMMMMEQGEGRRGGKWPWAAGAKGEGSGTDTVLRYYLQQQFGVNEFMMVPAAKPAAAGGSFSAGVGLEVVYEFVMTSTADPSSEVMGFVRGTALVVNSTAASTVFFVNNVIHWEFGGLNGTLSQQGEADFSLPPWEFSILSGTGCFRLTQGFNVGTVVSSTPSPNGTHIVTYYEAHLFLL